MRFDFDDARDRTAEVVAGLRASLAEARERLAAERRALPDRLRAAPAALRDRSKRFYARHFMPPSYTDDDFGRRPSPTATDVEGFDVSGWLAAGTETGPRKPPAEPRVVTDAPETPVDSGVDDARFDFQGWLAATDSATEAVAADPPAATDPAEEPSVTPPTVAPPTFRPHPVKAATYATFLALVVFAALSVVGSVPAMGPATGF